MSSSKADSFFRSQNENTRNINNNLYRFCKDFEIFPSLIGKNQLFNYFNMLIEDFDHYVVLGNYIQIC